MQEGQYGLDLVGLAEHETFKTNPDPSKPQKTCKPYKPYQPYVSSTSLKPCVPPKPYISHIPDKPYVNRATLQDLHCLIDSNGNTYGAERSEFHLQCALSALNPNP